MTGFGSNCTSVAASPPDPTKHVRYQLGMVLGAHDFDQEHAYLSERDRWLARDALGFGTVCGLRVTVSSPADGPPQVKVSPGTALAPRGRLVRVAPEQCAGLNDWLAANAEAIPVGSPVTMTLPVYVVLSYRERETDEVPIPGEPCRTEDDVMKPSRVCDDFKLELALAPPGDQELGALRDLVRWLRLHLEVSTTAPDSAPLKDVLDALRAAVVPPASPLEEPAGSPPPPDWLLDGSPGTPFTVRAEDLCEYLEAAFRVWVTELRPLWRPRWLGASSPCTGTVTPPDGAGGDSVLLARLDVPCVRTLEEATWEVDPAGTVVVDERDRPLLVHQRMLQEWLLCASGLVPSGPSAMPTPSGPGPGPGPFLAPPRPAGGVPESPQASPAYEVVAAGTVPGDSASRARTFGNLRLVAVRKGEAVFTFDGFELPGALADFDYVVKALPAPEVGARTPLVAFGGFRPARDGTPAGFALEVSDAQGGLTVARLKALRFVLEVTRYALA